MHRKSNYLFSFFIILFSLTFMASAEETINNTQKIHIELGDYRFKPKHFEVNVNQPVEIILHNNDSVTPHDFVLQHPEAGLDVTVEVKAGKTETVSFTPTQTGTFSFHCSKKLLFFKSHEAKGMHGEMVVK